MLSSPNRDWLLENGWAEQPLNDINKLRGFSTFSKSFTSSKGNAIEIFLESNGEPVWLGKFHIHLGYRMKNNSILWIELCNIGDTLPKALSAIPTLCEIWEAAKAVGDQ